MAARLKVISRRLVVAVMLVFMVGSTDLWAQHSWPRWEDLLAQKHGRSGRQSPRSGEWLKRHRNMAPSEQEKALERDPIFQMLPPGRQDKLRQKLRRFNNLPPDKREHIIRSMEAWDRLSPEQQEQGRELFRRFRGMPVERKRMMRQALSELRDMDTRERNAAINSSRMRSNFSDEERDILRGMLELNIGPAHRDDIGDDGDEGPGA